MVRLGRFASLAVLVLATAVAYADGRFDLVGPKVDVRVTRGGKTLPIASVPNLQVGDRLWLHPDLPTTQSVRYLMVVVFLRGTTNPPPEEWFTRIETWNKKVREEGVEVAVPAEAQQAIAFLAPVTGGDFTTLKSAVRGRPGIFVRASQDLNEAGFEQARIEKYLASIRMAPPGDAKALLDHSNLLSRTLALRPNPECFKRDPDQQITCLTQTGTQTLLDDGHGQTVVAALTTGASSDLISAASYTRVAGGGAYSAYVGAVVDLARLLGGLHTAQYQYIPAIAFPQQESLNLRLNTPPSFHNPKSVIVFGLPAIQKSETPPLRSPDAQHVTCLLQPNVAIPLDGAPLVFSTSLAHDLVLHLGGEAGAGQDLPLKADAYQGGLVLEHLPQRHALNDPRADASATTVEKMGKPEPVSQTGVIRGFWGFDPFEGPAVPVQQAPGEEWKVVSGEPLIAGHDDHLVLRSTGNACLESVTFDSTAGASLKVAAKPVAGANAGKEVAVDLPLASAAPGSLQLAIHQYGAATPILLAVRTYSDAAKLESVSFHAGDRTVRVTGQKLDQVREVALNEARFLPVAGGAATDVLALGVAADAATPSFHTNDKVTAHVHLIDGRTVDLPVTVAAARPALALKSISAQRDESAPIKLMSKSDLRVDAPITLILKGQAAIPRGEEIEVATSDQDPATALSAKLSFRSGALVLQDARTLRVTFDPSKVFGSSIFGPIRLRAVDLQSGAGDWIPVGTLVRLPSVSSLVCPADAAKMCSLNGSSLFLIDAVGSDQALTEPTVVPEEFSDTTLAVPRPASGTLYLHPRDDRGAVATLTLPVQTEPARLATGPRAASTNAPRE